MITTILFLGTIIINMLLTYNQKEHLLHKKGLFNNKETYIISNINRTLILILVILFFYVTYETREIEKKEKKDITLNNLDLSASFLSIIAAIIVLYVTAAKPIEGILDIENPNI